MPHDTEPPQKDYPLGRGYGHDYMRGGEVLGGYGYAAREEYEKPRGAQSDTPPASEPDEASRSDPPDEG